MQFNTIFNYEKSKSVEIKHTDEILTDFTCQQDTDIYALINKYGIKSLIDKGKPEKELFIDTTILPKNLTLQEATALKADFDEYFRNAPALFRKTFKDNPDEFYLAYKHGEYDKLIEQGALTEAQVNLQKEAIKAERRSIYREIDNEIKMEGETNELKNTLNKNNTIDQNKTMDKSN